jgi:DNA-binding MarR family transcriptional regulator
MQSVPELTGAHEASVLARLERAGHLVDDRLEAALADHGLSVAKMAVLNELARAEGALPLGGLAERLTCARSNITQLVDRLEAESLVRRVPAPGDRRSIHAQLTEAGRERWVAGAATMARVEADLLTRLSADERVALAALLDRLLSNELAPPPPGPPAR